MATCEICGNDYDKTISIKLAGDDGEHVFDSFECAIHALAPQCMHCGVRIVGHGVESGQGIYCCAHCAEQRGFDELRDRGNEDQADRTVAESFPASDPPANY